MATTVSELRGFDAARTLSRAVRGDEAAFDKLITRHQSMVYSIAWHALGDVGLAEEVAQEVFLQLYRNLDSIESPDHLVHWLRRVTTHRVIDESRRRRVVPVSLEDAPEPVEEHSEGDPLLGRRLREMIGSLPVRQRLILTLRYQEDLEPREIARALEMPVNTVKSYLRRALSVLRSRLEHSGER